jgi:phage FluMu protein Com
MVIDVTERAAPKGTEFDVVCPHCHKPFRGDLMAGGSERHTGFKCPHCKLFVAYDRAPEDPTAA